MKMNELREKTEPELQRMLASARDSLRMFRFRVAAKQMAQVSEIKKERKVIAQILTILAGQKKAKK